MRPYFLNSIGPMVVLKSQIKTRRRNGLNRNQALKIYSINVCLIYLNTVFLYVFSTLSHYIHEDDASVTLFTLGKIISFFLFSRLLISPVSSHLRGPFLGAPGSPLRGAISTQAATCLSALDSSPATLKSEEHFFLQSKLNGNYPCVEYGLGRIGFR